MDKEFNEYKKIAKEAKEAKANTNGAVRRKMYTVDKNGNKTLVEDRTVQLQPATTGEAFGSGKPQKTMETKPIPSEVKVNNADQTKDWMSVGKMLEK